MKRPLFSVGIAYLAGTVAAVLFFGEYAFLAGILCLFVGIICIFSSNKSLQSISAVFLSLGVAFGAYTAFFVNQYLPILSLDEQTADIKGIILEKNIVEGTGSLVVKAKVSGVDDEIKLLVVVKKADEIVCGDTVSFTGKLYSLPQKYGLNYNSFSKGIFIKAYPTTEFEFVKEKSFMASILHLREFVVKSVARAVPNDVFSIAVSMTVGDRSHLSQGQKAALINSGIMHLTAVSGTHLVIVVALMNTLIGNIRLSNRKKSILLAFGVLLFVAFTGFSFSVCRAGIMTIILLSAPIFGREGDSLTSWGIASLGILGVNPYSAVNLGFLSSMFSCLGIILFAQRMFIIIRGRESSESVGIKEQFADLVLQSFCISLSAHSLIIPLLMVSYGFVPIFSPLSTFLVGVIIPFVFIFVLAIALFSGAGLAFYARIIGIGLTVAVRLIMSVAYGISQIKFGIFYLSEPHIVVSLVMAYIFMGLLFMKKAPTSEKMLGLAVSAFVIIFANITFTILNMNVAQLAIIGESIVITESHRGAVIGNIQTKYEADRIERHLKSKGVTSLDAVLITGSTDNSLGYVFLLNEMQAEKIFVFDEGRYYPYIEKIAGDKEIRDLENAEIEIFRGIKVKSIAERSSVSTALNIGDKMVLKTTQDYDIIKNICGDCCLAVFSSDNYIYNQSDGTAKSRTIFGDDEVSVRY